MVPPIPPVLPLFGGAGSRSLPAELCGPPYFPFGRWNPHGHLPDTGLNECVAYRGHFGYFRGRPPSSPFLRAAAALAFDLALPARAANILNARARVSSFTLPL